MPTIAGQCHELRIADKDQTWRIIYHVASNAIVNPGSVQQEDTANTTQDPGGLPKAAGSISAGEF
jgi:hypothetical protein